MSDGIFFPHFLFLQVTFSGSPGGPSNPVKTFLHQASFLLSSLSFIACSTLILSGNNGATREQIGNSKVRHNQIKPAANLAQGSASLRHRSKNFAKFST